MNEPAIRRVAASERWPMTGDAWLMLRDELGQLRVDVAALAEGGSADEAVVHIPVFKAARRLESLTAVFDAAEKVHDPNRVVIGRRVTLLEEGGDSVTYAVVFPGDGDPVQGWISADSPLGSAVLERCPGDEVEVVAPAGSRIVTVVSIE